MSSIQQFPQFGNGFAPAGAAPAGPAAAAPAGPDPLAALGLGGPAAAPAGPGAPAFGHGEAGQNLNTLA